MKKSLKEALDNTDKTYSELVSISNDIVSVCTKNIDNIIKSITNPEKLSNEDIRNYILKISLNSYTFGDIKEKSVLKAECAEALRKEAYATEFGLTDGSVANKDSVATLNISSEILTEAIYNLVSSLLKTKLDEIHRIVDSLKTVLLSRMQEAKLSMNVSDIKESV